MPSPFISVICFFFPLKPKEQRSKQNNAWSQVNVKTMSIPNFYPPSRRQTEPKPFLNPLQKTIPITLLSNHLIPKLTEWPRLDWTEDFKGLGRGKIHSRDLNMFQQRKADHKFRWPFYNQIIRTRL